MRKTIRAFLMISAVSSASWAADPAPASLPATFKSASELAAALQKSMARGDDQATAPITNESHYRVNIVHREKPGPAMAHATGPAKGTEVNYILDGAATVVTGGTLVRPTDAKPGAGTSSRGPTATKALDVLIVEVAAEFLDDSATPLPDPGSPSTFDFRLSTFCFSASRGAHRLQG